MKLNEKELEKDESFIVEAKDKYSDIQDLQSALEDYFIGKYGEGVEISITFDDIARAWLVSTKNGSTTVSYAESIPKALHELM